MNVITRENVIQRYVISRFYCGFFIHALHSADNFQFNSIGLLQHCNYNTIYIS